MNLKFKRGFTLIEALAIMAIAAIILAAATPIVTKKHRKMPINVGHGRYESWWNGGTLMEREFSGEKLVYERPCGTSCTFAPPANVDKFLVQAVGGGGAGGGAGASFINSKYQKDEKPSKGYFQPVIVNGSGDGGPPGKAPWPITPGTFIGEKKLGEGNLRKLGYSLDIDGKKCSDTKCLGKNWFEWDHLDKSKNNAAYKFIGVACSGSGGSTGSSTITDTEAYWCLENEVRANCGTKITSCGATSTCSGRVQHGETCTNITRDSSCNCKGTCRCNPHDCNCKTTVKTRSDGTTYDDVKCDTCYDTCSNVSIGCADTNYDRTCTPSDYYKCPDECKITGLVTTSCKSPSNPCSARVSSTPAEGTPKTDTQPSTQHRNGAPKTLVHGGGAGGGSACTSNQANIISGISSKFTPSSGQGRSGRSYPACTLLYKVDNGKCPVNAGENGAPASTTIAGGGATTQKPTCTATGGKGAAGSRIPGIPDIDTAIVYFANLDGATLQGLGCSACDPSNNYETSGKKINGVAHLTIVNKDTGVTLFPDASHPNGLPIKAGAMRQWGENILLPALTAIIRAKYVCQGSIPGTNGTKGGADCSCSNSFCSSGSVGPHNYRYNWSRKYYNQWLAYGDAGQPGSVSSDYYGKFSGNLTVIPGRGGVAGNWSSSSRAADGKDGENTIIRMSNNNKVIMTANGGKGGQGSIVTDEYTLCSSFMLRTQPELCGALNAGIPQRIIKGGEKDASGLATFHAAFDMKNTSLILPNAATFGVGGNGQGSKSLCDSADDTRLVWNLEDSSKYVYDNRIKNYGINNYLFNKGIHTLANDNKEKCTVNNVYYMPNLTDAQLGKTHNRTVDYTNLNKAPEAYAPEFGGSGAVIITW